MYKSKRYDGVFFNVLQNGDKSYYVKYFVDKKQYIKKIGKHSEGVRENFCFRKRAELINEAKYPSQKDDRMTFDELAREYHSTKRANATYEEMVSRYEFKIRPVFGDMVLSDIGQGDIYRFRDDLANTKTGAKGRGKSYMSNSTVNYYMLQVSSMLRFAVKRGYISRSPAEGVKALSEDNARDRYLDGDEMRELVEAVSYDDDLLLFVEMSLSTGGRMKALMNICKKDINLESRTVSIEDEKGGGYYTAFLNGRVTALLRGRMGDIGMNDRIYRSDWRRMQRQMKKILDLLFNQGLDRDDRRNRVVIHTLRHTFASHLAINGTPIFTIQKLLNHKDIKQTLRYAKLSPDSGREEVERIWGQDV